jgi:hypothetical protein
MTTKSAAKPAAPGAEDAGSSGFPLCREPWENFYILRRGILPCCYGGAAIGQMADYAAVWNSPEIQEIRRYLSRGELSPYCLKNPGCPIVQRVLAQGGHRDMENDMTSHTELQSPAAPAAGAKSRFLFIWLVLASLLSLAGVVAFILLFVRDMTIYWWILSPLIIIVYQFPAFVVFRIWKRKQRKDEGTDGKEDGIPGGPEKG